MRRDEEAYQEEALFDARRNPPFAIYNVCLRDELQFLVELAPALHESK